MSWNLDKKFMIVVQKAKEGTEASCKGGSVAVSFMKINIAILIFGFLENE